MTEQSLVCTPKSYLDAVKRVMGAIDLDPCGNRDCDTGAAKTIYPPEDGRSVPWKGHVYVNPPWGYDFGGEGIVLSPWLDRCRDATLAGEARGLSQLIVCVPAIPCSHWWMHWVYPIFDSVCFVAQPSLSRLKMPQGSVGPPIDVAFLHWGNNATARVNFRIAFRLLGAVINI